MEVTTADADDGDMERMAGEVVLPPPGLKVRAPFAFIFLSCQHTHTFRSPTET
jgi:hypothetical protein